MESELVKCFREVYNIACEGKLVSFFVLERTAQKSTHAKKEESASCTRYYSAFHAIVLSRPHCFSIQLQHILVHARIDAPMHARSMRSTKNQHVALCVRVSDAA